MKKQCTTMDFLVPMVVLLLLLGAFFKWTAVGRLPQTETFTYRLLVSDLQGDLSPGETVLCLSGKQPVGTVVELVNRGNQTILILEAEGYPIDGGYRTNVYDIVSGFDDIFYTDQARFCANVTGMG